MDAPADLAVAFLALQRGLIDHRQLLLAWNDWAGRPGRPLSDLLVERGLLGPETCEELQRLAAGAGTPAASLAWPATAAPAAGPPAGSPSPAIGEPAATGPFVPPMLVASEWPSTGVA